MGRTEVLPVRHGPLPAVVVQVAPPARTSGNNVPSPLEDGATEPEHGVESALTLVRPPPARRQATPSRVDQGPPSLPPATRRGPAPQPAPCARTLPSPTRAGAGFGALPRRGQRIGENWQVEQLLGLRGPVVVLAARCVRTRARVALRVLLGGPRPDAQQLLVPQEQAGRVLEQQLHAPMPFVVVDHLAQAVSFWPAEPTHHPPPVAPVCLPPAPRGALLAMGVGLAVRAMVVASLVLAAVTFGPATADAMSVAPTSAGVAPEPRSDAQRGVAFHAELAQDRAARLARVLAAESEEEALRAVLLRAPQTTAPIVAPHP